MIRRTKICGKKPINVFCENFYLVQKTAQLFLSVFHNRKRIVPYMQII